MKPNARVSTQPLASTLTRIPVSTGCRERTCLQRRCQRTTRPVSPRTLHRNTAITHLGTRREACRCHWDPWPGYVLLRCFCVWYHPFVLPHPWRGGCWRSSFSRTVEVSSCVVAGAMWWLPRSRCKLLCFCLWGLGLRVSCWPYVSTLSARMRERAIFSVPPCPFAGMMCGYLVHILLALCGL